MFDVEKVRAAFPILNEKVHGRSLVYLDNAATAQMPQPVIDAIVSHYSHDNANVHRGVHELSARSTHAYEQARTTVARFIGAADADSIVFTSGATGALNMAASILGAVAVKPGTVVLSTLLEHHSNFVPWQKAAEAAGARFEVVGIDAHADLDMDALARRLSRGDVSVLACTHMSNITGTTTDIATVVKIAHEQGIPVVVDAAQSVVHGFIDVSALGCDFLAFSGHKLGSLTGIGVLYASPAWSERLVPYQTGGGMVDEVGLERTTYEDMPLLLEAGTPNYVGAISLAAAIDFIEEIGRAEAYAYEREIVAVADEMLGLLEGVRVLGSPRERGPVFSLVIDGVSPLDITTYLNLNGVAVRSGTGCAQPLLETGFGVRSVTRLSLSYINTAAELEYACSCIEKGRALLAG